MKYYLASRMQDRDMAKRICSLITDWLGWECTARWLDEEQTVTLEDKKIWSQKDLNDVFIASIALVNNCSIVTLNKKHFQRIKGLKVE